MREKKEKEIEVPAEEKIKNLQVMSGLSQYKTLRKLITILKVR